ncbi:peptide ABC transporter [Denitrobacterium detoxificans]|uniref:Peptide/nickel transport system ATP-binding protein n=1 Tax=Denitrobacterium detoxificans TaxID=79604 RepID=A0A172RZQ0_9ACTN|nr:ATP-binding cassette domain-containing protein [Denitrobacterium detoxificans]ANE23198.1 peptide ABC transporter [Denitrobacterium detoxificans]SEO56945.1 peptide/nickel transport system ATP-binding protein [Denitrobacterium detoxificans]
MLLSAHDVSFAYHASEPILSHVDFQIAEGEKVALFGPSGCGKSTLARVLCGLLKPDSGRVTWDNADALPNEARLLPSTGFLPVQMVHQHPERAVNPRWRLGKTLLESWDPPAELRERFGIEPAWKKRFPNELSGGELQRFCVMRALAPQTRILVCDEITTMLDVVTQAQIWEAIMDLAEERGMGVLVITHNAYLAERLCDRVVAFEGAAS